MTCQVLFSRPDKLIVHPRRVVVYDVTWATIPGVLAHDRHQPWQLPGPALAVRTTQALRDRTALENPMPRAIWLDVITGRYVALVEDPSHREISRWETPPCGELEVRT